MRCNNTINISSSSSENIFWIADYLSDLDIKHSILSKLAKDHKKLFNEFHIKFNKQINKLLTRQQNEFNAINAMFCEKFQV